MDRIQPRAPGCVGIEDDVVVCGRDNVEHDNNLLRLMQVSYSIPRNAPYRPAISYFFGSVYGMDRIRPGPSKIEDIRKTHQGRAATVHRFDELFGGIPHFTVKVSTLREFLKIEGRSICVAPIVPMTI